MLSVSLLAAACGGSDADTSAEAGADAGDAMNAPMVDDAMFSGEATTVTGETFELGDLAGQDLVLWFWAPW